MMLSQESKIAKLTGSGSQFIPGGPDWPFKLPILQAQENNWLN
ncbi:MAG: hypothetical protein P8130_16095 [Deltaproteobacteria bacterium]|jgi:hypothetical protein